MGFKRQMYVEGKREWIEMRLKTHMQMKGL